MFFSLGVILISRYARNVHLDLDMIILGELIFAPFQRIVMNDIDIGPFALWNSLFVLLVMGVTLKLCYYRLQLIVFDNVYAQALGIKTERFFMLLVALASISAVTAFDSVGSVVVVALMIVPVAAALLITYKLYLVIVYSLIISSLSAITGYGAAWYFNVSIAGAIGTAVGGYFIMSYFFAPYKGVLAHLIYYNEKCDTSIKKSLE